MMLNFKEFMSMSLSKDSPQGSHDLKSDELTVHFSGEESKNKSPKPKKASGINPEKMYGRRKKHEFP